MLGKKDRMFYKLFTTALLFILAFCTNLPAFARTMIPLGTDEWYLTVSENPQPTMVLVTGKDCSSCDEVKTLIEDAGELRPDITLYHMTNEQVPLPKEMLPYVMFSIPGQKTIVRGHGWHPNSVQDVMIFIAQREAYAAREEALEAALRGQTNKKKILEADNASSAELAKTIREIDFLSTQLTVLRSNNKLNAFGRQ